MRLFHTNLLAMAALAALTAVTLAPAEARAQAKYTTFIYTNDALGAEIQTMQADAQSRGGYVSDLLQSATDAGKKMAGSYVTSFIDMGVNAIASLITRPSRLKKEWEETVEAETTFETSLGTVNDINDFYSAPSMDGAMDPKGMTFNGLGCLRLDERGDTVFYVSCHVDRSKLDRIINHSKFELVLDTLILCPSHSNLPNSAYTLPYLFRERGQYVMKMDMRLTSSWINELTILQKDRELGRFTLEVPVDSAQVDAQGKYRYVRGESKGEPVEIKGESFIVPRSFMGYRDEAGQYHNSWGTGEYKMTVKLSEQCSVTDEYRDEWRADRKRRKRMEPKQGWGAKAWQVIESQQWDETARQWVITTLSAPAGMISQDLIEKMGLGTPDEAAYPM